MQEVKNNRIPIDWVLSTVSKVAKISTGSRNTQDNIPNGNYPFFVRSQTVERINSYSFDGEAVLTAGDGVGTGKVFHYINGKFDFHQRVYKISDFSSNVKGYFFYLYFKENFYNRIMQMTAKSSVDSVRMEMIANMEFPIPPIKEQTAIATALSDMDALISSLEKVIEKKRMIKQGAQQKLLTNNKSYPKVLIQNHCWFQEGPGVRKHQFTTSGVKLLNGTNIEKGKLVLEKTARFIANQEAFGWYSHFLVDDGDILIACSGVSIDKFDEKVTIATKEDLPLCMNTSTMRFKVNPMSLSKDYLFHFLKSDLFKNQIGGKATGSAQLNFGPSHMKQISIFLPDLETQADIANKLTAFDKEIEAIEQLLYKYKNIKQGMMQSLLTGKIRFIH